MRYFVLLFLTVCSFGYGSDVIVIGIAGGSGSGKTTVAHKIHEIFPNDSILICQDYYYKDLAHLPVEERAKVNFDHPDSIEFSLLRTHLLALKKGESVSIPQYDFTTYSRKPKQIAVQPKKIIIIEGLHLLAVPEIRELFNLKLFVDACEDIRLIRRINRDQVERGRTVPSILEQYLATVRPMHIEFIEPSKQHADLIIPEGGNNQPAVDVIIAKLKIDLLNPVCVLSKLIN